MIDFLVFWTLMWLCILVEILIGYLSSTAFYIMDAIKVAVVVFVVCEIAYLPFRVLL